MLVFVEEILAVGLRVPVEVRLSRLEGVDDQEGSAEDELDGEGSEEGDGSREEVGSDVWEAEKEARAEREEDKLGRSETVGIDEPETVLVVVADIVSRMVRVATPVAVPEADPLLVDETEIEDETDEVSAEDTEAELVLVGETVSAVVAVGEEDSREEGV